MPTNHPKLLVVNMPTYIYKYLILNEELLENGVINLKKKRFYLNTLNTKWINKSGSQSKIPTISAKVVMIPTTISHQKAMIRHYDSLFFKELCMYVDVRCKPRNVIKYIREFLDLYEITFDYKDDDLLIDSVWKRYQRHKKRLETSKQLRYVSSSNA